MTYDFDALKKELDYKKGVPLFVLYGVENKGVDLDFITTAAYNQADSILKEDIKKALGMASEQL